MSNWPQRRTSGLGSRRVIERELKPQQAEIEARLISLRNELSIREKRRKDLTAMLSTARSETAGSPADQPADPDAAE